MGTQYTVVCNYMLGEHCVFGSWQQHANFIGRSAAGVQSRCVRHKLKLINAG